MRSHVRSNMRFMLVHFGKGIIWTGIICQIRDVDLLVQNNFSIASNGLVSIVHVVLSKCEAQTD